GARQSPNAHGEGTAAIHNAATRDATNSAAALSATGPPARGRNRLLWAFPTASGWRESGDFRGSLRDGRRNGASDGAPFGQAWSLFRRFLVLQRQIGRDHGTLHPRTKPRGADGASGSGRSDGSVARGAKSAARADCPAIRPGRGAGADRTVLP